MSNTRLNLDQVYQIVIECRKSGLSDRQWCTDHGVPSSTFYVWLKKLRARACYDIPASESSTLGFSPAPQHQDVVRVDLVSQEPHQIYKPIEHSSHNHNHEEIPITIQMEGIQIQIKNSADPMLLANTLKMLKGLLC